MKLNTTFRYLAPSSRYHAGPGSISQIYSEAKRIGASRAFVISSETLAKTTDLNDKVRATLGDLYVGTWAGAKKESPIPSVMEGVKAVKQAKPDLIVTVGGGSAVVTGRAITIIVGEDKTIEEMYTKHTQGRAPNVYRASKPKIPNIIVNTTPTTGTDRGGAAIYDSVAPHRKELYDPKTRPLAVIIDPQALLTAPLDLYRDTSLTTFSDIIASGNTGGLQAPELNPLAYADERMALELSVANLPKLVEHPNDGEARVNLCLAAILCNRASQSTYNIGGRNRTTGLGYKLRYHYAHIGQGAAGAVMLATNLRINLDLMTEGMARIADVLRIRLAGMTDREAAQTLIVWVESFLRSIGAATRLRDLNVPREDLRRLAEEDVRALYFGEGTGRITDPDELFKVLEMAY